MLKFFILSDIDHNVTGRMKDELDLEKGHTHTFSNFPHSAESDDEEGGDKTEVLLLFIIFYLIDFVI